MRKIAAGNAEGVTLAAEIVDTRVYNWPPATILEGLTPGQGTVSWLGSA